MDNFVCLQPIEGCPFKLFTKFFTRGILKISAPPKIPGPVSKVPPRSPSQRPSGRRKNDAPNDCATLPNKTSLPVDQLVKRGKLCRVSLRFDSEVDYLI